MIDTGGGAWQKGQLSMGDRVLVPFLRSQGITKLDEMLLTHLDLDHRGGAEAILGNMKVKQLRSNEHPEGLITLGNIPFVSCEQGQSWQWDSVQFDILWPSKQHVMESKNESSCVLLMTVPMHTGELKVLLMGDTGWQSEYYILQQYPDLKVNIIVLGHHGSKYSSAYDFLNKLDPDLAITSAGIDNRYGHPTPEVISRLNALQIPHLTTIGSGRINISVDQQRQFWKIHQDRQRYRWLE